MPKLKVPGRSVKALEENTPQAGGPKSGLQVTRRTAIQISGGRAAAEALVVDAKDESVLVLHLEGGHKLFCRYDQFRLDFPDVTRDAEPGTYFFQPNLASGSDRAIGTAILKGLEIIDIKPDEQSALALAHKVEKQLEREQGLYRLSLAPEFSLSAAADSVPTGKTSLVLVHGTASSSRGSYKGLAHNTPGSDDVKFAEQVRKRYGDNIFAFEHRTLTEGPIANALAIARKLPDDAQLHLVTHSRGGLIGELLCLGQLAEGAGGLDPRALDQFSKGRDAQRKELDELLSLLRDKRTRVERFVRVACPARGTTLASARADRWFSNLLSLIGQLPFLQDPLVSAVYEALQDFLMATLRQRTDPLVLPGIEAMMPQSPLIRLLNIPAVKSTADLSVIAGDTEGKGVLGAMKMWLPDRFYGGMNDLVVNTASMDGGVPRATARIFFDQGADVDHFHYFLNERTQRLLLAGLVRSDQDNAGFSVLDWKPAQIPDRGVRAPSGPLPVVFLLPGEGGSHLSADGHRVWLDYADLSQGGLEKLAIGATGVRPESLLVQFYGQLANHLSSTHEVVEFAYDWRFSLRDEAKRLAERVSDKLDSAERNGQPVRILAHSMGGLLARVMVAQNRDLWRRIIGHPGGRLVMLGTPNHGTHEILRLLTGQSRTIRQLQLLEGGTDEARLRNIIGRYPGLLEMLPRQEGRDFFDPAAWEGLRIDKQDVPLKRDLADARQTRALLDAAGFDSDHMVYVAGTAPATPSELVADGKSISFRGTPQGDGRVPWSTIPSIPTYYSAAEHGDLVKYPDEFPAIVDLLQTGTTTRLPKEPPTELRSPAATVGLPPDNVEVLPDERAIAASALGATLVERRERPSQRIRVCVAHSDLAFARYTIAVGHYEGDSIVGPEGVIDRHLKGRLKRWNQLGAYPDKVGTAEIFLNPDPEAKFVGAIVVGLGRVGTLTPGEFERSYYGAVLKYALTVAERPDERFRGPDGSREANITTLLIGTMASVLTVEQSVTAMLRAIRAANATLDASGGTAPVLIRNVEFLELWEGRAIQIANALRHAAKDPLLREMMEPPSQIDERGGGLRRLVADGDEEWWGRLRVTKDLISDSLRFAVITNRARAEVELVPQERTIVDDFIRRAIGSSRTDPGVASALFEMLVPNRLKEYWPEMQRTVVVVDKESARYPWELLEDRLGRRQRPISVDCGFIRQLETEDFRHVVVHGNEPTAFVVGNPKTTKFPPLPGARREAEGVDRVLRGLGISVTARIDAEFVSIVTDLHAKAYRILHLAGHGVHEYQPESVAGATPAKPISGMVIGDNEFLTPAMIRQMRRVPELVFINCCHLARTDTDKGPRSDDRHRLAANLAAEFIQMGVKAVIAAGWAVDDIAASTFATRFYEYFLANDTFGEAVRKARADTYQAHPGVNTWGAYQCYGDPDFSYAAQRGDAEGSETTTAFVLPSQVVAELNNLARQAEVAADPAVSGLRDRLNQVLGATPKNWMERADILYSLGCLHGELGDYEEAAECYSKAAKAEKALGAVRGIEQEASMRVKAATRKWATGKSKRDEALAEIDRAILSLGNVLKLGATSERLALKAGAHKRRAMIDPDPARRLDSLRKMTDAYKASYAKKSGDSPYSAPLLNWLLAGAVLRWADSRAEDVVAEQAGNLESYLQVGWTKCRADPSFWNMVVVPDCLLVRYLSGSNRTDDDLLKIAQNYRQAKEHGASARQVQVVVEHLDFVAEMARALRKDEALASSIERCRDYVLAAAPVWVAAPSPKASKKVPAKPKKKRRQ